MPQKIQIDLFIQIYTQGQNQLFMVGLELMEMSLGSNEGLKCELTR